MDWILVGIIGVAALVIVFIFFRKVVGAFFLDVLDAVLSTLDNFVGGAGLAGLDFGDWIAALIIYAKERKISGTGVALFAAWEATNFLPLSFIPGVGEGIEIVFNLVPTTTALRLLFNKFGRAEQGRKNLEHRIELAKALGVPVGKAKKEEKKATKDLKQNDPVDAVEDEQHAYDELGEGLVAYVSGLLKRVEQEISETLNQDVAAPEDLIDWLGQQISQARANLEQAETLLEEYDFEGAIVAARQAEVLLINAREEFNVQREAALAERSIEQQL